MASKLQCRDENEKVVMWQVRARSDSAVLCLQNQRPRVSTVDLLRLSSGKLLDLKDAGAGVVGVLSLSRDELLILQASLLSAQAVESGPVCAATHRAREPPSALHARPRVASVCRCRSALAPSIFIPLSVVLWGVRGCRKMGDAPWEEEGEEGGKAGLVMHGGGLFPAVLDSSDPAGAQKTLARFRMLGQLVAKALQDARVLPVVLSTVRPPPPRSWVYILVYHVTVPPKLVSEGDSAPPASARVLIWVFPAKGATPPWKV